MGVILGTAAYMAPEQARGKAVDKRADIWSFGVVLYELLKGEWLFIGEGAAETLAAVIQKQPDLAKVSVQARKLLRRCLEKDSKKRLRDIGETQYLPSLPTQGTAPQAGGGSCSHWNFLLQSKLTRRRGKTPLRGSLEPEAPTSRP